MVSEEDEQAPNRDDSHEIANRDIKPTQVEQEKILASIPTS
tara:strand:+ start:616 stop:738 length:123 start_codon:yes stop_codon:yes gene_type:complete